MPFSAFPFLLPPGRWAIGVSGGADSVALARLAVTAAEPAGRRLVLAHLDHQLRGEESDGDATFVAGLGQSLGVPTVIGRRDAVERAMPKLAANPSARYRAARLAFFADVVRRHELDGVLLAHHADDQAETVLLRQQRGSGPAFLSGMRQRTVFVAATPASPAELGVYPAGDAGVAPTGKLVVIRPLLGVRRDQLRAYLHAIGQTWREDASNTSPKYRRNVVRQQLAGNPSLTPALLKRAAESQALRDRLDAQAPRLMEQFATAALRIDADLAEHAVRRWLVARGAPPDRVSPAVCQRLIAQATDVTQPPRQHYPGRLLVRRRAKIMDCMSQQVPRPSISASTEEPG